jgi:hypothetical protein
MAVDWYVDKGLGTLIAQVKAKFPGIVVGTIGDASHRTEGPSSDHNPEADGSVDAADFMLGKAFTKANAQWLRDTLCRYRDDRIAYVIWDYHITSSTVSPWDERVYSGNAKDPHTNHVHVSVNDKHENDKTNWKLMGKAHSYVALDDYSLPILTKGMDDRDYDGYWNVKRAQELLGIKADGVYGNGTQAAVKAEVGGDGKTIDLATWVKLVGLSRR